MLDGVALLVTYSPVLTSPVCKIHLFAIAQLYIAITCEPMMQSGIKMYYFGVIFCESLSFLPQPA